VSYKRRRIDLSFRLNSGSFGQSGENTATVSGLRVSATISKAGATGFNQLSCRIFGLDPSIANQIATLGKLINQGRNNTVTVSAGDDAGTSVIFVGTIMNAYQDFQDAPNAALNLVGLTNMIDALRPLPASSFRGGADVADIISGLAKQMGYGFENSGVSVILNNQYLSGTGRQQVVQAAQAANVNFLFDDQPVGGLTVAIWPKDSARKGAAAVLLEPDAGGLVGYPQWVDTGVILKCEFNPSIAYGAQVQVKNSVVTNANGAWYPYNITHEIESEMPGGKWFTTMEAQFFGGGARPA
jgi:hypothetical protein